MKKLLLAIFFTAPFLLNAQDLKQEKTEQYTKAPVSTDVRITAIRDFISIHAENDQIKNRHYQLTINDLTGKIIFTGNYNSLPERLYLNLQSGFYIISCKSDKEYKQVVKIA
jgi:hypothetical protein